MKEDFANMTDQEKEFMRNYLKFVKRIILFGIAGFFIFLLMMSRDVHRHFVE